MKYSVERSIVIDAEPDVVRPYLENLKNWRPWSPWAVIEPTHEQTFTGVNGEVGSSMRWVGDLIGSGQLTLVKKAESRLDYDLVFLLPWKSQAKTAFLLSSVGKGTRVTWVMNAAMPFFLFFMIGMIKAMVGMDYDRGLTMLKSLVETGGVDADTTDLGVVDFTGFSYLGLSRTSHLSELPEDMSSDFEKLMCACSNAGLEPDHVISVYNKVKLTKQLFSYTSAIAGDGVNALKADLPLCEGVVGSQKMLEIKHRGSYAFIANAWAMGNMILRAKKMKQNGAPFEYYHNDPTVTPENELLTSVYFPIKG